MNRIRPGNWRQATVEASLRELLSDEAAKVLMRADRVTVDDVRAAVFRAATRAEGHDGDSTLRSRGGRLPARHPRA